MIIIIMMMIVSCAPIKQAKPIELPPETACDRAKSWAYNHNSDVCDCLEDFGCEAIDAYCEKMARIEDGWE